MTKRYMFLLIVFVCLALTKPVAANNYDYFEAVKEPYHEGGRRQYLQMAEVNHLNKVVPHFAAGRIDYAVNELRFVLNAVANHPRALMLLIPVAKAAKNTNLGISFFEKALKLYPQYAITHAQYGWYLVETGNLEAGIFKLKQAIEMDAKLVAAHVWLAQAYNKSGNAELARQAAEQARELGYNGQIPGVN